MEDLQTAIERAEWVRGLTLAIEAWRATRTPAIAELVDAIAARIQGPVPPPRSKMLHPWWMSHATLYRPERVAVLVAHAATRSTASDVTWTAVVAGLAGEPPSHAGARLVAALAGEVAFDRGRAATHTNAIQRLAALLAWPDDPRAARVLADWLVGAPVRWDPVEHGRATQLFYEGIAERLIAIGDPRVVPQLEACVAAPRGPSKAVRSLQQALAGTAGAALRARAVPPPPPGLDACLRAVGADRRGARTGGGARIADEDELWRECARHPDEVGPRLVLADLLVERGDPRGELIALQCDGGPAAIARAKKLINAHWGQWLGDLALVLNRKGTEFRRGMLEVVRVGVPKSPEWAFGRGHRELGTVHTVRPGHVRSADYAAFVAALDTEPARIAIDAPETVAALRALRTRWAFRALEYGHYSVRDGYRYQFPPLADTFQAIAAVMPDLAEIRFEAMPWPAGIEHQLRTLIGALPGWFPKLTAIVLDEAIQPIEPAVRALPLVQVVPQRT